MNASPDELPTPPRKVALPVVMGVVPGMKWRIARRALQTLAWIAIGVAPLLGGWQRLDRNYLAVWDGHGWDLPGWLLDLLPLGNAPRRAYEAIELAGGGVAVEYFSIPIMDPVAGLLALGAAELSAKMALAWLLPIVLGLVAGRAFCGWFCPFGTLSRLLEAALKRSSLRSPPLKIPSRRWVRWVLLASCIVLGVSGVESFLYFTLPHAVLQQSAYSLWLMGGSGAFVGWLLGLLFAGYLFGPTSYCATLCPTGTVLSLAGRASLVGITLDEVDRCGRHCALCSKACWLGLDPASGDPGPDCDACTRCFSVCPRANLKIGLRRPIRIMGLSGAALLMLSLFVSASDSQAADLRHGVKPRLLFEAREVQGETVFQLAIEDLEGVRLDADDPTPLHGVSISALMTRGKPGVADERGRLALREIYTGPLFIELSTREGTPLANLRFEAPAAPLSTPNQPIYRSIVDERLPTGTRIEVLPIAGWLEAGVSWRIPAQNPASHSRTGWSFLVSVCFFSGLLALAFGAAEREDAD